MTETDTGRSICWPCLDAQNLRERIQARNEAIAMARDWLVEEPLFLDSETTGLSEESEIVSIGIVDLNGKVLVDEYVRPRLPIPPEATEIHGISNEKVRDCRTFEDVYLDKVEPILKGRCLVIYNASFDTRMLNQSLGRKVAPWRRVECAMLLSAKWRAIWGRTDWKWPKLGEMADCLDVCPDGKLHGAVIDSQVTREVLQKIAAQQMVPMPSRI
jgi:DNA polymerase-3 subunit epsilon